MNSQNKSRSFLAAASLGLAAGFVSLVLASIIELVFSREKLGTVFLFVFLEEMLKLGALFALFKYRLFDPEKLSSILLFGVGAGIGFSVFETALIFLSFGNVPLEALRPVMVHVITSLLLAWSIRAVASQKSSFPAFWPICFAVIIHLCYNILVIIGI